MNHFDDPLTKNLTAFLNEIGIETIPVKLDDECFLPGILVDRGRLLVDESKLKYPGDLLHEAGHLAVAPAAVRPDLSGEVIIPGANMDAVEVQVTAWAYAAILHLELEPRILFHDGGYKGKSESLILTFGVGVYPGASGLADLGMTAIGEKAVRAGIAPYPNMLKWVND